MNGVVRVCHGVATWAAEGGREAGGIQEEGREAGRVQEGGDEGRGKQGEGQINRKAHRECHGSTRYFWNFGLFYFLICGLVEAVRRF